MVGVHLHEGVEDCLELVGWDAAPSVLDTDIHPRAWAVERGLRRWLVGRTRTHRNVSCVPIAGARELDGVRQNVDEDLPYAMLVAMTQLLRSRCAQLVREDKAARSRLRLDEGERGSLGVRMNSIPARHDPAPNTG